MQRFFAFLIALLLHAPLVVAGELDPNPKDWRAIEEKAKGQTVYWNAWAGEQSINSYIDWAAAEVYKRYGVRVEHVKLSDTAQAVSKVIAEKAAGERMTALADHLAQPMGWARCVLGTWYLVPGSRCPSTQY